MSYNYHYYQQAKNLIQQEELKNGTQHTILLNCMLCSVCCVVLCKLYALREN